MNFQHLKDVGLQPTERLTYQLVPPEIKGISTSTTGGAVGSDNAPKKRNSAGSGSPKKGAVGGDAPAEGNRDITDLFNIVRSVGEECQSEEDLRRVLVKSQFNCYDGFEPSGRMHIAQGIFKAINVNKCTSGGNGKFIFWVADWFGLMNDKMGGDLEKIKTVGKYFIKVWSAAGMDMKNCEFRWTSNEITTNANEYWAEALDIARVFNIARIKKCCTIMGRSENKLSCAQILYPVMQCADIFFLKADICQLGVDQRKVNMLARDYCDAIGRKKKPVILSHHMLLGLKAGQAKMSKSDPDSAIFMEDSPDDVRRKIMNAYCPLVETECNVDREEEGLAIEKDKLQNPCLDYVRYIIMAPVNATFTANNKTYTKFDDVKADLLSKTLPETQLKEGIIREINKLLDPVRKYFQDDKEAKDLLAQIAQWKKEEMVAPKGLKRAKLCDGNARIVFAPPPAADVSIQNILKTLEFLEPGSILFISEWSDFVNDKMVADRAAIDAYYTVLINCLKAFKPKLMETVKIHYEKELVLGQPSEYWISVINAGRATDLGTVAEALKIEEVTTCGQVVSFLMYMGNLLSVSHGNLEIVCSEDQKQRHLVAEKYLTSVGVKCKVTAKQWNNLHLMPDDISNELMASDTLDEGRKFNPKLKKSFMEPQNVEFCPMINLFRATHRLLEIPFELKLTIKDKGDITFTSIDELETKFKDGTVHPSDLKPASQVHLAKLLSPPLKAILDKKVMKNLETAANKKEKKRIVQNH